MAWPGLIEICQDFKGTCCCLHNQFVEEENTTDETYVYIMQIILWVGSLIICMEYPLVYQETISAVNFIIWLQDYLLYCSGELNV